MFAPALSLILAALAGAAPLNEARQEVAVASVDRYAGPGCTGTVCNLAGSGDLYEGCNVVTGACTTSMKLSYANEGCSSKAHFPTWTYSKIFVRLGEPSVWSQLMER